MKTQKDEAYYRAELKRIKKENWDKIKNNEFFQRKNPTNHREIIDGAEKEERNESD